jgi:hypothetical protein
VTFGSFLYFFFHFIRSERQLRAIASASDIFSLPFYLLAAVPKTTGGIDEIPFSARRESTNAW